MVSNTNTVSAEFSEVLRDEIARLRPQANDPQQCPEACADQAQLMGLALSGGGIRSATFCLGVIQALARLRLLRAFDYLSTVSGGGYIGAWLSTLIHRSRTPGQPAADALAALEGALSGEQRPWCAAGTPPADCPPEHPALSHLRRYSNYLTPRLGPFSGDTLAAVSTYMRNLLLNQITLVAFFSALLTLPYLLFHLAFWLVGYPLNTQMGVTGLSWLYSLAIFPLVIAVFFANVIKERSSHRGVRFMWTGTSHIVTMIIIPSLISAWLLALALQSHVEAAQFTLWQWVRVTMLVYLQPWVFVLFLKMDGLNLVWTALKKLAELFIALGDTKRLTAVLNDLIGCTEGLLRFALQIPWTLLAGALGGVLFYTLSQVALNLPSLGGIEYATAFGTPLVLLSYSALVMLYVVLMKRLHTENDREWWTRLGGILLLTALVWASSFAVTLYAVPLMRWLSGLALAVGFAWIASSIGGVLLGKSSFTGPKRNAWWGALALAAPYVFILGLMIVLASALNVVLTSPGWLCETCVPSVAGRDFGPVLHSALFNLARVDVTHVVWVGGACAALFGLLGRWVDINLFSLHGFYCNRLTRCYLGATRMGQTVPLMDRRSPDPFSGFDPKDDLPLSELGDQRPFPIINTAMNLTGGDDLAWQTRQAASFAFTPCYTGFEFWNSYGNRIGAYRRTVDYAANQFAFLNAPGGVLLGNVVATSGAAANPNMGYHTSAPLAALMSMFNVRLGHWYGNPLHPKAWSKASPRNGGLSLINEMFGQLTSRSAFLNISDGGHFENLGIYELVRRRCHIVVAVDAGCDPDYQFEDMANAIRKCRTDFGVRIEIELAAMRPQGRSKRCPSHFSVGCIRYPNAPEPGVLIYIKASLTGDESSDVKEYADRHSTFPHESTGDQFFDENQFESYRELGRHIGLKVFAPLFPPQYVRSRRKLTPEQMTPEQLRDTLLDMLPEHPTLQARRSGGKRPFPPDEAIA